MSRKAWNSFDLGQPQEERQSPSPERNNGRVRTRDENVQFLHSDLLHKTNSPGRKKKQSAKARSRRRSFPSGNITVSFRPFIVCECYELNRRDTQVPHCFDSGQTAWLRDKSKTSYESSILNRTGSKSICRDQSEVRGRAMNVEYEWRRLGLLLYSKVIAQNSYHESQKRMPQSPKEMVTGPRSLGEPRNGPPIEFTQLPERSSTRRN